MIQKSVRALVDDALSELGEGSELLFADGRATLFMDPVKVTEVVRAHVTKLGRRHGLDLSRIDSIIEEVEEAVSVSHSTS